MSYDDISVLLFCSKREKADKIEEILENVGLIGRALRKIVNNETNFREALNKYPYEMIIAGYPKLPQGIGITQDQYYIQMIDNTLDIKQIRDFQNHLRNGIEYLKRLEIDREDEED